MEKKYCEDQERLARFTKALGHPARLTILCFLAERQGCFFGEIEDALPIAKATVFQHLSDLKEVGLIKCEAFSSKVKYCIDRENWDFAHKMMDCFWNKCEKELDGK